MKYKFMKDIFKLFLFSYLTFGLFTNAFGDEDFFKKGLELYKDKKYDDAKFMFERSIVFNPKEANSYLYLAKIYNHKEDQNKEEKI